MAELPIVGAAFHNLLQEAQRDRADQVKVRAAKQIIQTSFGVVLSGVTEEDVDKVEKLCMSGSLHERRLPADGDDIHNFLVKDVCTVIILSGYLPPIPADPEVPGDL
ncbi:unnamed protein product, partial [Amoebophrya sp. A25]|eukprot:GSA25T00024026001.1